MVKFIYGNDANTVGKLREFLKQFPDDMPLYPYYDEDGSEACITFSFISYKQDYETDITNGLITNEPCKADGITITLE